MKKILQIILATLIISSLNAKQYFIAPGGNDTSPGTLEQPFATFLQAHNTAQPGDTIWVRGGVHQVSTIWTISKPGQLNAYYNLWGYRPDIEKGDSVILNVSAGNGIRIQQAARFWHIRDLVIQNSSDNGMRIEGSYNIIERCVFRNNSDSGLTIQQSNGTMPNDGTIAAFNLVLNCDSYFNDKDVSNADGFACKLSPGAGNVFRGCRAWANGDDGWDFYYSRFQIIVEDCWTFTNGIKGGNGNGFKSNGSASSSSTPRTQAPHVYIRCIAFDHKYKAGSNNKGFDQNHNEGNVTMINCLAFDNEKNYAYYEDTQNNKNHVLRNCVGFGPYSEKLARTLLPGEVINAGTKDEISYVSSNTWFGNTIDATFNSWNLSQSNPGWNPTRADYVSLTVNDAKAPRQADGSLPGNGFGRLKPESLMKNAGISHTWELELPLSAYPNNPNKPPYVFSTLVTTPDSLNLTFASSGDGNRNLNVYVSSDGGATYSSAFVQAGAANGVAVPVKFALSDKVSGEGDFVLKLEAANTIELWNVEVTAYEKIKSDIKPTPMIINNIRCMPAVTTGFLVLSMELQESVPVAIDLYTLQGKKVTEIESQTFPAGVSRVIADISMNPAGMYLVRFSAGQEAVTFKVVKN